MSSSELSRRRLKTYVSDPLPESDVEMATSLKDQETEDKNKAQSVAVGSSEPVESDVEDEGEESEKDESEKDDMKDDETPGADETLEYEASNAASDPENEGDDAMEDEESEA